MRPLQPEVFDALWKAIRSRIPVPADHHPKGGHRPRISDRLVLRGIVIRLVTGCSWVSAEELLDRKVSDTTLRARFKTWTDAGVFEGLVDEAIEGYDRVVGLDLSDCAVDGSLHKAPVGGEGTGRNPTDRAKTGWKWSVFTERNGIPLGWAIGGANRNDSELLGPTMTAVLERGYIPEVETLHLDKGYDGRPSRDLVHDLGIDDLVAARRTQPGELKRPKAGRGMRWPVERTNSWFINFGQLRRNTDRKILHRLAQLALAITLLLIAKLIDHRDRWGNG